MWQFIPQMANILHSFVSAYLNSLDTRTSISDANFLANNVNNKSC